MQFVYITQGSLLSCSVKCLAFSYSVYLMLPKSVYILLKKLVFVIPFEDISYFYFWIFQSFWNQVGINIENGFHHPWQLYWCHFIMNIHTTVHYFWLADPPVIIVIIIPCKVHIQTYQQYYTTESLYCFRIFCKLFSFGWYVVCCEPSSCLLHSPTHSLLCEIHGFIIITFLLQTESLYPTIFLMETHSANSSFL